MNRVLPLVLMLLALSLSTPPGRARADSTVDQALSGLHSNTISLDDIPRILAPPAPCVGFAQSVISELRDYNLAARGSRDDRAESSYHQIQGNLSLAALTPSRDPLPGEEPLLGTGNEIRLHRGQKVPSCHDVVASAYALGSLALLQPLQGRSLVAVAAVLLRSESSKIDFLDPVKRREYGCLWDRPGKRFPFGILGGYDCARSEVRIDPTLRPFNLGASFAHEIDHLTRDKFGESYWANFFKTDFRHAVLVDEVFANVLAAYLQRRKLSLAGRNGDGESFLEIQDLAREDRLGEPGLMSRLAEPYLMTNLWRTHRDPGIFKLKSDNNLFSRNGNLQRILDEEITPELGFRKFLDQSGFLHCGNRPPFAFAGSRRLIIKVYETVSKGYFHKVIDGIDELVDRMAAINESGNPATCGWEIEPLAFIMAPYDGVYPQEGARPFAAIRPALELLNQSVDKTSLACDGFTDDLSTQAPDYLGSPSCRPSGEGTKPGSGEGTKPGSGEGTKPGSGEGTKPGSGEGTKPGSGEGTKPGSGEGTKPGSGEGTKPGSGEGTKPGTSVKPCLAPNDEI